MARPDMALVIKMILKSEGYDSYERLAKLTYSIMEEVTNRKNSILYGGEKSQINANAERVVVRDVKVATRFSILLRDQEWSGYLERHFAKQRKGREFEMILHQKKPSERVD